MDAHFAGSRLKDKVTRYLTCVPSYCFRVLLFSSVIRCYFTFTWSSFDLTLVAELCSCISFCSFCSRVLSFGFLIRKEPSQNRCWCSLVVNNPNHNNNHNNCSVQPLLLGIVISPLLFIQFSTNQPTKTLFVVFCLFCLLFKLTTNNLVVCCFFVCCVR